MASRSDITLCLLLTNIAAKGIEESNIGGAG